MVADVVAPVGNAAALSTAVLQAALRRASLFQLAQIVHVPVAVCLQPVFVGFNAQRTDQRCLSIDLATCLERRQVDPCVRSPV